ncbi:hypothetical protein CRG98_037666 [Punica granatum]|uniref:Integrase catalytic domain-containing protein n=1 Tax=Punica granatum TaxID=22663 RepID=A0A2I0IEX6_PUNGR|nr:hypothetical protein CRG98_037666 [Punica granatum]
MVERPTRKLLKCLRTDNGREYALREFKDYCARYGIRHERIEPDTLQHNGVVERMNRTILEKVKCMLIMTKLPKPFWGEIVNTACYLINQSPYVPSEYDIPERVWTSKNASYSHLKIFGYKSFMHMPKEQRSKLDDKAKETVEEEKWTQAPDGVHDVALVPIPEEDATDGIDLHEAELRMMRSQLPPWMKKNTYGLVELPNCRKALQNKWVFKLKKDGNKLVKYKARLVVKGFTRSQDVDFDEIFSPVVKMSSIIVVLGLAASLNLELE